MGRMERPLPGGGEGWQIQVPVVTTALLGLLIEREVIMSYIDFKEGQRRPVMFQKWPYNFLFEFIPTIFSNSITVMFHVTISLEKMPILPCRF